MPGQGKYGTVYDQLPVKKPVLERLFRSSPQYDGSYTLGKLVDAANAQLLPDVQQGDLTLFPSVNMNFGGAPKFGDVVTGDAGKPSTAYTPNPASPGEGNGADPTKMPDAALQPGDIKPGFVPGENGTAEPASTSPIVSSTKLGKPLTLGSSPKP